MRYANACCECREVYDPHAYIYTGKCIETGKLHSVRIPGPELYAYRKGALIQDAMPSVSDEDREFLISGLSPEAWKQLWSPAEDFEDATISESDNRNSVTATEDEPYV